MIGCVKEAGVADQVLLSAGRRHIETCLTLASQYDVGIEVMAFAYPDVLDGDWKSEAAWYAAALKDVSLVTMHGPFLDMSPGSPDKRIDALVRERYRQALDIAPMIGARTIVFHANFIGSLRNADYRIGWHARNVEFWGDMARFAAERGVVIAVENMWEFDPHIIADILQAVHHPHLRACIDVGHAHVFSDVPFEHWLAVNAPYIVHTHLNNNDGVLDIHGAFPDGVLDYRAILPRLRALPHTPTMTLEMDEPDMMRRSLSYFELAKREAPLDVIGAKDDTAEHPRLMLPVDG
jgi:sugar phosphate isomerase/epimerase